MIIVNGWKPLIIITKRSILDVAAVLDPPLVSSKRLPTCSQFLMCLVSVISANIPTETDDPMLFKHVQTYPIHSHSISCKKYKNKSCHFNFGKFFASETIIAQPVKNFSEFERFSIFEKRDSILSKVSQCINEYLDLSKTLH